LIKSIRKEKLFSSSRILVIYKKNALITEIFILRKLRHPSIIKMYEIYESENYVHLVCEYLKGKDLLSHIENKPPIPEKEAAAIIKKLLEVVSYIHYKGIIHRDLKFENLYLVTEENMCSFKIADFGLAAMKKTHEKETLRCGTPGYIAPEILDKKPYDEKVDIFSIGIMTYMLLSGTMPFKGNDNNDILLQNKACILKFQEINWINISGAGFEFVKKMTASDPSKRPNGAEALNDEWFKTDFSNIQKTIKEVVLPNE